MLYVATAAVAAPAFIERRTFYTGGTTADDVVKKGSEDDYADFDGKSLILCSTMYTSYIHLRPRIY